MITNKRLFLIALLISTSMVGMNNTSTMNFSLDKSVRTITGITSAKTKELRENKPEPVNTLNRTVDPYTQKNPFKVYAPAIKFKKKTVTSDKYANIAFSLANNTSDKKIVPLYQNERFRPEMQKILANTNTILGSYGISAASAKDAQDSLALAQAISAQAKKSAQVFDKISEDDRNKLYRSFRRTIQFAKPRATPAYIMYPDPGINK